MKTIILATIISISTIVCAETEFRFDITIPLGLGYLNWNNIEEPVIQEIAMPVVVEPVLPVIPVYKPIFSPPYIAYETVVYRYSPPVIYPYYSCPYYYQPYIPYAYSCGGGYYNGSWWGGCGGINVWGGNDGWGFTLGGFGLSWYDGHNNNNSSLSYDNRIINKTINNYNIYESYRNKKNPHAKNRGQSKPSIVEKNSRQYEEVSYSSNSRYGNRSQNRSSIGSLPNVSRPSSPRTQTTLPSRPNSPVGSSPRTTMPSAPRTTMPSRPNSPVGSSPRTTMPSAPRTTMPSRPNSVNRSVVNMRNVRTSNSRQRTTPIRRK
jgi:hypothetical protein